MTKTSSPINAKSPLRCAVIGCGAAAKEFCLPVLRKHSTAAESVVLVDRNIEQAEAVAEEFGLRHVRADITSLPFNVDAAFITTPHKFHAEQALHFIQQGAHVFIEKPLGMTVAEVSQVLDAASVGGRICMVNNYRRLFPSYQRVRELLQSGQLGKLRQITIEDGTQFAWNSASSFYLRDPQTRGVFLDRGAHTIDVLCWWLGEQPRVVAAHSDAFAGVEGLMDVQMLAREATIKIKFSRFYRLANSYTIEGDRGSITGRLFDFGRLSLIRDGHTQRIVAGKPMPHYEYAWRLVDNFLQAVQGTQAPLFSAHDVAPSITVIEQAYQQAARFELPWYTRDPNIAFLQQDIASAIQGKSVS